MAGLRLLSVLIVLAAVCWEANCWKGYIKPKVCSDQVETYNCTKGEVFKVRGVKYQKIKGFFNYTPWSTCMVNLSKKLRKKCEGTQSCRVNPAKLARPQEGCKKQDFCLLLTLQCQSKSP